MKQVSQGGTELIIFKRQEKGDWVGGPLLEPPSRPEAPRPIVLEMENQMLPARKDPTSFSSQISGQKARRLNSLLS